MTGLGLDSGGPGALSDRYLVPPFSVLDTRQDNWRKRRRWWLGLGIESEIGRGIDDDLLGLGAFEGDYEYARSTGAASGTSIFDPVLCELAYRWWCPPGGTVLDPFAGGSVRGIVAATLGHPYIGIDLSAAQVAANEEQARRIIPGREPRWSVGDSRVVVPALEPESADMVLTCPPYYDLEVYSDDPADLSAAPTYAEFLTGYRDIIAASARVLRPGSFAVVVVSEVRAKDGTYVGLVPDTIRALGDAGMRYYNEAILVNSVGSLPLRVGRYMASSRKLGRTHQNVIVAVKGDAPREWPGDVRPAPADPQGSLGWDDL